MKYKYRVEIVKPGAAIMEKLLNDLGSNGYNLLHVQPITSITQGQLGPPKQELTYQLILQKIEPQA